MCIEYLETLRLYPILPFMDRRCTVKEGYSLEPYSKYRIPYGTVVFIPVYALHMDPKVWDFLKIYFLWFSSVILNKLYLQYFPDPKKFDPERFSPENRDKIVPYTYQPFGIGPHNCIGERFGLVQTKIGLINFLRNHYVTPSDKMPKTLELDKKSLLIQCEGGIHLNVVRDAIIV